jgi:glycosyltransferase involved in cell wall biosynthesis
MKNPWLSILIPIYNVENYLEDCIQSVLSQHLENVEVIVVDDKSTDASLELVNNLAGKSAHAIKILQHEKNAGLSAARNTLVSAATGGYLWFLDSDDRLAEGAVLRLRNVVEAHNPDLVLCDFRIWRPDVLSPSKNVKKELRVASFGGPENTLLKDPIRLFAGLYQKGKLHSWSKISTRALWSADLRFPEGKYFEDMFTTPRLALKTKTFFYVPEAWVFYRKRPGSILATPSLKKIDDMSAGTLNVLNAWLAVYPAMDVKTRFVFVGYCLKIYAFVLKDLRKLDERSEKNIAKYRDRLYQSIGLDKRSLVKHYLRHGNVLRLIKFWRFL